MIPVDMAGTGEQFDDVDGMIEQLGPKGAAEAFMKARAYFEENKDKTPDEDRAQPMTAVEWRQVLAGDGDEMGEGEEEEAWAGEEGAFGEGGEEEYAEGDDAYGEEGEEEAADEDGGPAAKKAKTE